MYSRYRAVRADGTGSNDGLPLLALPAGAIFRDFHNDAQESQLIPDCIGCLEITRSPRSFHLCDLLFNFSVGVLLCSDRFEQTFANVAFAAFSFRPLHDTANLRRVIVFQDVEYFVKALKR